MHTEAQRIFDETTKQVERTDENPFLPLQNAARSPATTNECYI